MKSQMQLAQEAIARIRAMSDSDLRAALISSGLTTENARYEGVAKLPRRRDAALASGYTKDELTNISTAEKETKLKKFSSSPLTSKYFKL